MDNLLWRAFKGRVLPSALRLQRRLIDVALNSSQASDGTAGARAWRVRAGMPNVLQCHVAYNQYGAYCVPDASRHRPAARAVLAGEVYEPDTIAFMRANCKAGDIVHAGTYFGDFLPALATALAPAAKVWAFEPSPESYRCARITLELNAIDNVVLTRAGLGAERASGLVRTLDDDGHALGGASRITSEDASRAVGAERVEMLTVDEAVGPDRQVSLLQLDVEGHEQQALAGALETIRRCRPHLIVEVLPNSTLLESAWFANHILALGYRKLTELHGNSVFSCVGSDRDPAE